MKKVTIILLSIFIAIVAGNVDAQITLDEASQKQMAIANLSSMPLASTENLGQWGEKTLFKADANGATFYFCKDEVA